MVQCQNSIDPLSEIPYDSVKLQCFPGSVEWSDWEGGRERCHLLVQEKSCNN